MPARRGRGSGRGRGNAHDPRSTNREARRTLTRARARSAAPLRGGGTDATEMAALREQIETMKTSLDAANGKVCQLESEREDHVAAAGAGSTSAGEGRTPAGDTSQPKTQRRRLIWTGHGLRRLSRPWPTSPTPVRRSLSRLGATSRSSNVGS